MHDNVKCCKVAWLLQESGSYWQPIMSGFTQVFPDTMVFTALQRNYLVGFEGSFKVKQVGKISVVPLKKSSTGYGASVTFLSPEIVRHLLEFKPEIVFSSGFTMWTLLVVMFKPIGHWRIVIVYDGSSPGVDYKSSKLRLSIRKLIGRFTDAFISNTQAGGDYLRSVIGIPSDHVYVRPYLIPSPKVYLPYLSKPNDNLDLRKPLFLFVGNLIPRKGLHKLLEACSLLKDSGHSDYTLVIAGDGDQRQELEAFVRSQNLNEQVQWLGRVDYEKLGFYFQAADVFVFPTLEDVWGLVAVEAMLFGLPILCSKWAGAAELVAEEKNGYVFDPDDSAKLAELMLKFIDTPDLISRMGEESKRIMKDHTLEQVVDFLHGVVENTSRKHI
jgi:glycosyltransferase involved in cell wall biosynthesis